MPYVNVEITERFVMRSGREFDPEGRKYAYMCPFEGVEVGDHVVVPFGDGNYLRRAVVHEVGLPETLQKLATKWVVAHGSAAAHEVRAALKPPPERKKRAGSTAAAQLGLANYQNYVKLTKERKTT